MGKCVVKECSSRSQKHNKANGITFHTIPKHPLRQERWIKNIRLLRKETDWLPTKSTIICSHHFREEDKIYPTSEKGRVYLSDDAVPIFEDYNFETFSPSDSNQMIDSCEVIVTDEEIDKITESLKEQKMRQKIERLQIVSNRRFKKIKNLEQKNRRLKARNKFLKDIIKEMRRNVFYEKITNKTRQKKTIKDKILTEIEEIEEDETED